MDRGPGTMPTKASEKKTEFGAQNINQDKERHCTMFFKSVLSDRPSLLLEGIWSLSGLSSSSTKDQV